MVIVITTGIGAPNLNSRKKIPTSTVRTPLSNTRRVGSDARSLEKVARGAPEAVAEFAQCREIHGCAERPPRFGQVEPTSSRANSSGSEIAPTVVTSHTTTVVATQDAMPWMVSP